MKLTTVCYKHNYDAKNAKSPLEIYSWTWNQDNEAVDDIKYTEQFVDYPSNHWRRQLYVWRTAARALSTCNNFSVHFENVQSLVVACPTLCILGQQFSHPSSPSHQILATPLLLMNDLTYYLITL